MININLYFQNYLERLGVSANIEINIEANFKMSKYNYCNAIEVEYDVDANLEVSKFAGIKIMEESLKIRNNAY